MSRSALRHLAGLALCGFASTFACSSSTTAPAPPGEATPAPADTSTAPPADDAPAAPPGLLGPGAKIGSGGDGGLKCMTQEDLGGGRKNCVAKIGNLEVKVLVAAGGTGPLRLGVYLHGDGAAAHKSNSALKAMVPWVDTHHGLAVSILAPNGCSWWQTPAYKCAGPNEPDDAAANTPPLVAALSALLQAYDVRRDGIRYYGASGGSIFLTEQWIPLQGGSYPGVFALMCGGEASGREYGWNVEDASLVARNRLWFTYGDEDHLYTFIKESIADFKAKSFAVTEKIIPNAGHCEFDAHGEAVSIWSSQP